MRMRFTADPWDGEAVDTAWFDAEQTAFTLNKPEQLAGLAALVNEGTTFEGKTITLTENISLGNKEWTPIGDMQNSFKGTFNGTGCTISDIAINQKCVVASYDYLSIGLFGYVEDANISNLKVDGCLVIDEPFDSENFGWDAVCLFGGICGMAHNSIIERCTNSIDFDASNVSIGDMKHGAVIIGGICAMGVNEKIDNGDDYSKKTIIRDCLNEGNFKLLGNDNGCPGSVGITGVIDSDYFCSR